MSAKLGDILIQQGVIDEEKLIAALSDQRAFGGKLGRTLVDLGYVTEEQLVNALATQLGLDTIDLTQASKGGWTTRRRDLRLREVDGVEPELGGERVHQLLLGHVPQVHQGSPQLPSEGGAGRRARRSASPRRSRPAG